MSPHCVSKRSVQFSPHIQIHREPQAAVNAPPPPEAYPSSPRQQRLVSPAIPKVAPAFRVLLELRTAGFKQGDRPHHTTFSTSYV